MRITTQRFTCEDGHRFNAEVVVDAPVAVVNAAWAAAHCSECGSAAKYLGGAIGEPPPLTERLELRAAWWLNKGETGISSLTIYAAMTGDRNPGNVLAMGYCWPWDSSDFNRCKKLLDLLPEWRADLAKVTARFAWFKPLADNWAELEALLIEEEPTGQAPKLYKRIKELIAECEAIKAQEDRN